MRLIDTDVLIDHFHNVQAATNYIAEALLTDSELFISSVSVAEILAGIRPGEEIATEELLGLFTIWPTDEAVARMAGNYLKQFARRNKLELGDALIAATAKILNADLITRNIKHYPMTDIVILAPYQRGR